MLGASCHEYNIIYAIYLVKQRATNVHVSTHARPELSISIYSLAFSQILLVSRPSDMS